ncbi:MAG: rhamnogalacturonan acetylesterase [Limisphaerales bacterium]
MKFATALAALVVIAPLPSLARSTGLSAPAHRRPHWASPANPNLPTLFIIGDSTVRNGEGVGTGGQWGWGDLIAPYFNTNKINVVNRALGGTSSRTFYRDEWPAVRSMLKPGDFLLMQFGHNDSSPINDSRRARGTIKGAGNETEEIENLVTKRKETVHTFGWYERNIIAQARLRGATPMVCSLIPRNIWRHGRVVRNSTDYAGWAAEAAKSERAPFLDLNDIIADDYDALGREKVQPLFVAGAGPHTSLAGARTNAMCVISALKGLKTDPLSRYFSDQANAVAPAILAQSADGKEQGRIK